MLLQTSTWTVIVLLVSTASLASYAFFQWAPWRDGTLRWASLGLGTTMLATAAALIVLAVLWLSALHFSHDADFDSEQSRASTAAERGWAAVGYVGDAPIEVSDTTVASALLDSALAHVPMVPEDMPSPEASWASTACVIAVNRGPVEPTRWTFENHCGKPVAVAVATGEGDAGPWTAHDSPLFLPARNRRPVTASEETRHARAVRYLACAFTSSRATELIGLGSELRSSPEWLAEFREVTDSDDCLNRVQQWSRTGYIVGPIAWRPANEPQSASY